MIWQQTFDIEFQAKQSCSFNGHAYTPKKKRMYVESLRAMALLSRPETMLNGPVCLSVSFVRGYPKSWPSKEKFVRPMVGKPDLDNLIKPLKDALSGVVYRDDSQVVQYELCEKKYGVKSEIIVKVFEI